MGYFGVLIQPHDLLFPFFNLIPGKTISLPQSHLHKKKLLLFPPLSYKGAKCEKLKTFSCENLCPVRSYLLNQALFLSLIFNA